MNPADRVGFCQNCGRPLDAVSARPVGSAMYCEPCLEARLTGAPQPPPAAAAGYTPVYGAGGAGAGGTPGSGPAGFTSTGYASDPALPSSRPNPTVAGFLGLIPGVGAMYNEQYAKGIVHLLVFAVLISLSHSIEIFGLLGFGWICYMAIEAYHTARARRDGTPLPNPFGLNDLGDRLGFGRLGWAPPAVYSPNAQSHGQPYGQPYPPSSTQSRSGAAPFQTVGKSDAPPSASPFAGEPAGTVPPGGFNPGTPPAGVEAAMPSPYSNFHYPPPSQRASDSDSASAAYNTTAQAGYQYVPAGSFGAAAWDPVPSPATNSRSSFPVGAIWLIGLGSFFFLATTGIFRGIPAHAFAGLALIGLGIWLFLRRFLEPRPDLAPALRITRALRGSAWLTLIGILLLLNEFRVLGWTRSWPLLLILGGVLALAERLAQDSQGVWLAAANASNSGVPRSAEGIAEDPGTRPDR